MLKVTFLLVPNDIDKFRHAIDHNNIDELESLIFKQELGDLLTMPLTVDNKVSQCAEYDNFTLLHYACDNPKTTVAVVVYLLERADYENCNAVSKADNTFLKPMDFLHEDDKKQVLAGLGLDNQSAGSPCGRLLFGFMAFVAATTIFTNTLSTESKPAKYRRRG